jgi:hypothetical protein
MSGPTIVRAGRPDLSDGAIADARECPDSKKPIGSDGWNLNPRTSS